MGGAAVTAADVVAAVPTADVPAASRLRRWQPPGLAAGRNPRSCAATERLAAVLLPSRLKALPGVRRPRGSAREMPPMRAILLRSARRHWTSC